MNSAPKGKNRPKLYLGYAVHAGRVAILLSIVWLIHDTTQLRQNTSQEQVLTVPTNIAHSIFGEYSKLEESGVVKDRQNAVLGRLLQTSPKSDHIVGFSGPTNVLIAVDQSNTIIKVKIIESKDTKEHIQQVVEERDFLRSFKGKSIDAIEQLAEVDAVSGATLTSLAITESIIHRLGGGLGSLKFPEPPPLTLAQKFFASATRISSDSTNGRWDVFADDEKIGFLQSSAPAADQVVGYQGPTETILAFDLESVLVGLEVLNSYDNEPYVGYVRDDPWFPEAFLQKSNRKLADLDLDSAGVEGVSGATMTSMAVADAVIIASAKFDPQLKAAPSKRELNVTARDIGTIVVFVAAIALGFSGLRGKRWVRMPFQLILIVYLGFINCDILSQALLVGWAQHGIPWENMFGMALLTTAAFALPIFTKRNVYCHQICPHGAAQQWLRPPADRRFQVPRKADQLLTKIPALLIILVLLTAMGSISVNLVGIEPFDAYVIGVGGSATIAVALVGLISSAFVPMAYCKYGCPTGALLEFTRRTRKSDKFGKRDFFAIACLALALLLRFSSQ